MPCEKTTPPADPGESWRPIGGYESHYLISNAGRVWSMPRVVSRLSRCGNPSSIRVGGRLLRHKVSRYGYAEVNLHLDGAGVMFRVHRLVLAAFVSPCHGELDGCHNNGDPLDNRVENLRWDTRKNNMADAARHGRIARGVERPHAKLTDAIVREIRTSGESLSVLSSRFGVGQAAIRSARLRLTWKHVK